MAPLPDQGSGCPESRLCQIRRLIRCVLRGEQDKRFAGIKHGLGRIALGGSPPTQRIRKPKSHSLGTVWRNASQPVDQSPGGGAVTLPERVFHEVEIGGRER